MAISPKDFGASFKGFLDQMSAAAPAQEPIFRQRLREHFNQESVVLAYHKYAVEDAVVAANLLAGPLKANKLEVRQLAQVQRQRQWPTWFIQALSAVVVKQILQFVSSKGPPRFPLLARLLIRTPLVRHFAPQIVAFGINRVHVEPSSNRSGSIQKPGWRSP